MGLDTSLYPTKKKRYKKCYPRYFCSATLAPTVYHDMMCSQDCEGQWAVWKLFWWAGPCKIYKVQATKHVLSCPPTRKNRLYCQGGLESKSTLTTTLLA